MFWMASSSVDIDLTKSYKLFICFEVLEDQIRAEKRLIEFVVEPTGKKKSGDKNDHICRPLYSFIDRHCPSFSRCGEERERLFSG
jgi:hypothetical protein